jgi:hypothetical protein
MISWWSDILQQRKLSAAYCIRFQVCVSAGKYVSPEGDPRWKSAFLVAQQTFNGRRNGRRSEL